MKKNVLCRRYCQVYRNDCNTCKYGACQGGLNGCDNCQMYDPEYEVDNEQLPCKCLRPTLVNEARDTCPMYVEDETL